MTSLASLLAQNPDWSLVLAAYAEAEQSLPPAARRPEPGAETEESPGDDARWVPRLHDVQGIDDSRLPRVHGRLIAEGLLRFNLLGRTAGIGYRLTPAGRQALGLADQLATPEEQAEPSSDEYSSAVA